MSTSTTGNYIQLSLGHGHTIKAITCEGAVRDELPPNFPHVLIWTADVVYVLNSTQDEEIDEYDDEEEAE